jgi:hypothetical protein
VISICILSFFQGPGCKNEEQVQPAPAQRLIIRKPIIRPVKTPPVNKTKPVIESKPPVQQVSAPAQVRDNKKDKSLYMTEKDETLANIAGKPGIYNDPLKWPVLFRMNMEKLMDLAVFDGLYSRELPHETSLKIIRPNEIKNNLKKGHNQVWVINILSTGAMEKIEPMAIKLMKNGYNIYIYRTNVKGKKYFRLRVGFFSSRTRADQEGKKMMSLLNLANAWTVKIGEEEKKEFGGL